MKRGSTAGRIRSMYGMCGGVWVVLFTTLFVCAGVFSVAVAEQPDDRPNIIFLLTDDQRDNTFGAMGHDWIQTPHVDRLINESVRFSNAYIAEPTCSPSRVSLFTGMYERVHGVGFSSSYRLNEEQWSKTYPALLRQAGYHTGFIGKFGVEYYTFRGNARKKFDFWRGHDGWARFFPKEYDRYEIYHDSPEDIITPIMGSSIDRFLNQVPSDKPFCLSVSFSIPHGSQTSSMWTTWKEPANNNPKLKGHPIYGDLYRDLDIEIPEETGTDPHRYIPKRIQNNDAGRNRTYHYNYTRTKTLEHWVRYHQVITGLDNEIGQMMDTLEEKGLDEHTIILFASDHGLLMGEYGLGGKGLLYDLTAKIPCFVYDPRLPKNRTGRTVDELVSSLDITSTILDYAGIEQPDEMQGRSLVPLVKGKKVEWREHVFLENLYTGRDTPFSEGVRKGKWKYIRMYDGVEPYTESDVDFEGREPDFEQLFNLKTDPAEKTNLIGKYEGTELLSELRELVQQKSKQLNRTRATYKQTHKITGGRN